MLLRYLSETSAEIPARVATWKESLRLLAQGWGFIFIVILIIMISVYVINWAFKKRSKSK